MAMTNNAKALSTKTGNAKNTRHRKQGRELSYAELAIEYLKSELEKAKDKDRFMRKILMPICPGCGHYVFRNLRCDDEKDAADNYVS